MRFFLTAYLPTTTYAFYLCSYDIRRFASIQYNKLRNKISVYLYKAAHYTVYKEMNE